MPTRTPAAVGYAEVVWRGNTAQKSVAFSFDTGADAGFTSLILDTLKSNAVVATFCVTGRWAETNRELLSRIAREGHQLVNHSYDHPSFTGQSTGKPPLSQMERWAQLDRAESVVKRLTGVDMKPYARPPYGDYDESVNADLYARGYLYNVMWTVDSLGWKGAPAEEIVRHCIEQAAPGVIYVFHVGAASQDGNALPAIIDGLHREGFSIGSVRSLLEQRGP